MLTVKQWDDYVRFNKARADKEMCNSVQLRESILDTLQQTSSDLLAQHTATAYGYRHRLHEYAMALDELYYRKKLVSELPCPSASRTPSPARVDNIAGFT